MAKLKMCNDVELKSFSEAKGSSCDFLSIWLPAGTRTKCQKLPSGISREWERPKAGSTQTPAGCGQFSICSLNSAFTQVFLLFFWIRQWRRVRKSLPIIFILIGANGKISPLWKIRSGEYMDPYNLYLKLGVWGSCSLANALRYLKWGTFWSN